MAATLTPTRNAITPRHSVLGFRVQTGIPGPSWFDVVMVTDPALLDASAQSRRTHETFARSGWQHAERGEAVYLVPPSLLERFQGKEKLYYAISVATSPQDANPQVTRLPAAMLPYVKLAPDLAAGLRRIRGYLNPRGGLAGEGTYGATAPGDTDALTWPGDHATPGAMEPAGTPATHSNGHTAAVTAPAPAAHATALEYELPYHYDDGYEEPEAIAYAAALQPSNGHVPSNGHTHDRHSRRTPARPLDRAQEEDADSDGYGITGPEIEDDEADMGGVATASAVALDAPAQAVPPPYPGATFDAAASVNYQKATHPRTVDRIVIHITDGGSNYRGTVGWFKNPDQRNSKGDPIHVSAHYVIGQGGQIVQMVPHADIAWHASKNNTRSIGIEHTARSSKPRLLPTEAEFRASACLVRWLCQQYGFPADREHIVGHNEISPWDGHTDCPNGAWDWDHYMDLVANADCSADAAAQGLAYAPTVRQLGDGQSSFSLNWDDVEMIGQPTSVSCWATAAAMVLGWRDSVSMSVDYVGSVGGRTTAKGLAVGDERRFAADIGLTPEPPQSYSIEGFRQLLESYGPLWVGITPPGGGGHAIVVTGIYSDGNPDGSGTYVRITDPWDRVVGTPGNPGGYLATHITGSRYILTWDAFTTEYEMRITSTDNTVNAQILHSATAFGHQPNRSGAAGYAQSLAADVTSNGIVHSQGPGQRVVGRSSQFPSIEWDLEQFEGVVSADGDTQSTTTTETFQDGPTIVLDDWPYMSAPHDAPDKRVQAICLVHWQHSGRSVGHVRIEPGALADLPGYALAVRASISPEPAARSGSEQGVACLDVRLDYQFTRPDASVAHASTSIRLYANGAYDRSGAWQ